MKKKIIFLLMLVSIFCFSFKKQYIADASSNEVVTLIENCDMEGNQVKILPSGLYFVFYRDISINNYLIGDIVSGDYNYDGSFDNDAIEHDNRLEGEFDLNKLENIFVTKVGEQNLREYGYSIFRILTNGAIAVSGQKIKGLTVIGYKTSSLNTSTSIGGNMTHFINIDNRIPIKEIEARYTANDAVEGDVTDRLEFQTNYDPNDCSLGQFYITATVSDSVGNINTIVDIIHVIDVKCPVIDVVSNKEIPVKTPFTSEEAYKLFKCTDNSGYCKVSYDDNYNSRYNEVGQYYIIATAVDESNNKTSATLTINVVDKIKPTITLKNTSQKDIKADHVLSDEEIKNLFSVTDNYDTLSSDNIIIEENTCTGTEGQKYILRISVTDSSGNKQDFTVDYYLLDKTAPTIFVTGAIYVPEGVSYTNEEILKLLKEAGIIPSDYTPEAESLASRKPTISTLTTNSLSENEKKLTDNSLEINSEENIIENKTNYNNWYHILTLIPILGAIGFVIIKNKKNEKN